MKKVLKVLLVVLAALVVLVALGPTILSTGFGRRLAEWALAAELGRSVSMGRLEVGYFSGTLIERLEIGPRAGFGDEPLVKLERLECDSTLLDLIRADELAEVSIEKLELSVVRLADGRMSIDDLAGGKDRPTPAAEVKTASSVGTLLSAPSDEPAADAGDHGDKEPPAAITVPLSMSKMRFHFRDEQFKTDVTLEDLDVQARYDKGLVEVTHCAGKLNEGELTMTASVDLRHRPETFQVDLKVSGCKATSDLSGLGLQVPLLYNPLGKTRGVVSLDLSLSGRGFEKEDLKAHLAGRSVLEVRELTLEGSKMLAPLLAQFGWGNALTFGQLKAESSIAGGRITSGPPGGEIRASHSDEVTLVMTGYTTFDGEIDYLLKFGGKKVDKARYANLAQELVQPKLKGTLGEPQVAIGLLGGEGELKLDDLKKLKDLFKKREDR